MAEDRKYFAWADDLEAHANNKENPHGMTAAQIGAATPDYVDEQIAAVSSTGIPKLQVYPLPLITATEGQTEFFIDLSTYSPSTDTVLVQKGNLWLNPNGDYMIIGQHVVLTEAVKEGTTVGIWVFKNVPIGEEGSTSGIVIAPGTMPIDRLAENVATQEYVDNAIASVSADGIPKLVTIPLEIVAETDGQTEFTIEMETFDANTDTVLVLDGRGLLLPNSDYTVSGNVVTVTNAWNAGDVGGLLILKNVPVGDDGTVSGAVIADGTIGAEKLANGVLGGMDLLWENADTTSELPAQTIAISNMSDYSMFVISTRDYIGNAEYRNHIIINEAKPQYLQIIAEHNYNRSVTPNASGLAVGTTKRFNTYGNTTDIQESWDVIVPYKIYGIK